MPFRKLSQKGQWLRVKDVDGDVHWIHGGLVTDAYRCGVVKVKRANLRTGPGSSYGRYSKYPKADHYESFKVLKFSGNWLQITDDYGDKPWIFRELMWVY